MVSKANNLALTCKCLQDAHSTADVPGIPLRLKIKKTKISL
jgi:hypothetical protein